MTRDAAHQIILQPDVPGYVITASNCAAALFCLALHEQGPVLTGPTPTGCNHLTPVQQTLYRAAIYCIGLDIEPLRLGGASAAA